MQLTENTATILTLLGAGPATIDTVHAVFRHGAILVAADGGVRHAAAAGLVPDQILGDLDSLPEPFPAEFADVPRHHIADQDSTDFDKALRSVSADLYLCAGFLDGRTDHTLACLHTLVMRADKRILLVSETDVIMHMPRRIALDLPEDTRVSLFPMRPVQATSDGLRWPLADVDLAPDSQISTSNAATGGRTRIRADRPGLLLILPREHLGKLIPVLLKTPVWGRD
ncbi:thiamine diphosphokinase [Tropicimonas sp. S265A]|uniref:thiamine diphosphokinase n=1 Tax=Tropicimonas sp. S265A TaxID=3415134 RepID=UPI003C7C41AF